jgi:excisionase family DNA binding protein
VSDLLLVPEVAAILRISKALAYRLVSDGAIPSARIGCVANRRGRLVVRRQDVDDYLDRLFAAQAPPAKRVVKLDVDAIHARVRRRLGRPTSGRGSASRT